jgi:hypothetical protein
MRQDASSQLRSFVLPFSVLIVLPALLLACNKGFRFGWGLGLPYDAIAICVGLAIIIAGMYLLIDTILLFRNIGKGTGPVGTAGETCGYRTVPLRQKPHDYRSVNRADR